MPVTSSDTVQEDGVDETPSGVVGLGTATVALSDESQTATCAPRPTNAAVLSRLRHGQTLTVLERYANWTYVQYGTLSGYVMNDYIETDAGDNDSNGDKKTPIRARKTAAVRRPRRSPSCCPPTG